LSAAFRFSTILGYAKTKPTGYPVQIVPLPCGVRRAVALRIRRENADEHLAFGWGRHHCVGDGLALMEMRVALEELSRRLPQMRLEEASNGGVLSTTRAAHTPR
jgi:hypothetical protein